MERITSGGGLLCPALPYDVGDGENPATVYDRTPGSWGISKPWNLPVTPTGAGWIPKTVVKSP